MGYQLSHSKKFPTFWQSRSYFQNLTPYRHFLQHFTKQVQNLHKIANLLASWISQLPQHCQLVGGFLAHIHLWVQLIDWRWFRYHFENRPKNWFASPSFWLSNVSTLFTSQCLVRPHKSPHHQNRPTLQLPMSLDRRMPKKLSSHSWWLFKETSLACGPKLELMNHFWPKEPQRSPRWTCLSRSLVRAVLSENGTTKLIVKCSFFENFVAIYNKCSHIGPSPWSSCCQCRIGNFNSTNTSCCQSEPSYICQKLTFLARKAYQSQTLVLDGCQSRSSTLKTLTKLV